MIKNIFALVVGQPFSGTLLFGTRKKRSFYSQADCEAEGEGGGASAPSALTVSKCENFDPFLH